MPPTLGYYMYVSGRFMDRQRFGGGWVREVHNTKARHQKKDRYSSMMLWRHRNESLCLSSVWGLRLLTQPRTTKWERERCVCVCATQVCTWKVVADKPCISFVVVQPHPSVPTWREFIDCCETSYIYSSAGAVSLSSFLWPLPCSIMGQAQDCGR